MKVFTWIARLVLGGVFIAASIPKIADPHAFATIIFHYQLGPHALINLLAIYLPWAELILGVCLIIAPQLRQGASILILGMLAMFTIAIGLSLYRGIDITCGCFSVNAQGHPIGWFNLARNAFLIATALALIRREARR